MTASDNNEQVQKLAGCPLAMPRRPGTANGVWGNVLARARSVVSQARCVQSCVLDRPDLVHALDDHLLLDIGLSVDAVRHEAPRLLWPN